MSHLGFQTEMSDNESETNSVTSDELIISSNYLDCCSEDSKLRILDHFLTEHFLALHISPQWIRTPQISPPKRSYGHR